MGTTPPRAVTSPVAPVVENRRWPCWVSPARATVASATDAACAAGITCPKSGVAPVGAGYRLPPALITWPCGH
jgi:hypothetical protein